MFTHVGYNFPSFTVKIR